MCSRHGSSPRASLFERSDLPARKVFRTFSILLFAVSIGIVGLAPLNGQAQGTASSLHPVLPQGFDCDFERPVRTSGVRGEQKLYVCRGRAPVPQGDRRIVANRENRVFVAVLSGSHAEIARAHGDLLGDYAESGVIHESIDHVNYGVSQQSLFVQPTVLGITKCLTNHLYGSLSDEFRASVDAYYQGYSSRMQRLGRTPKFSPDDLKFAAVGIELANTLDAMNESGSMLKTSLRYCPLQTVVGAPLGIFVGGLFGGIGSIVEGKTPFKLGCTGFIVPEKTSNGSVLSSVGMVHGRNLDGELMRSWSQHPVIFLIRETGKLAYLASGSAGLIYPAGVSGTNEAGISASLHQMYSARTQVSGASNTTAMAPALQEKILREARSLDDALRIARGVKSMASWTIFISDAKTGEAASIELTEGGVSLSRRVRALPLGQSNHFFDAAQAPYAYFPNLHKKIETEVRLQTLDKKFASMLSPGASPWTLQEAFDQLANQEDAEGRFQAFGTTATKAYGVMATIMLPDQRQLWMSSGDASPAPHSTYLGIEVDASWRQVRMAGVGRAKTLGGRARLLRGMENFVLARLAYERGQKTKALSHLNQSIQDFDAENVNEPNFTYMRARLYADLKDARALNEFNRFLQLEGTTEHHRALAVMFRSNLNGGRNMTDLAWAKSVFERAERQHGQRETRLNIETVDKLMQGRSVSKQKLDWVVFR